MTWRATCSPSTTRSTRSSRRSPTSSGRCRRRARAGRVADQIGHLTYFDGTAALAITDPDAFADRRRTRCSHRPTAARRLTLGRVPGDVARRSCSTAGARTDAASPTRSPRSPTTTRVVWYGPSMGAKSFLTARLMETWAHGQDIVDTVGAEPTGDRPAPPRRPARVHHPRLVATSTAASMPPDVPVFVELDGTVGRDVDVGSRRRRRIASRVRRRTSASSSRSGDTSTTPTSHVDGRRRPRLDALGPGVRRRRHRRPNPRLKRSVPGTGRFTSTVPAWLTT